MKTYQFKCKLLSDMIITSLAATEGYAESLDYIPGSKFLGIAASKLYDEMSPNKTLDIFHNGTVRFGDASPLLEGSAMIKVPFSWYHEKGKSITDQLFLHHKLSDKNTKQLKQARSGYFSPDTSVFVSLTQDFSLKSAQDAVKRKSSDGQMFGYYSLKAGTDWTFTIKDDKDIYADEIKACLVGKHRVGRSRSAEFGLVEIDFMGQVSSEKVEELTGDVVLYAKSNLCFIDEQTGQFTSQPTARQLTGIEDAEILWDKCQLRTRNYKTWNRKRNNKDTERTIIERGSVFVVKLNTNFSSEWMQQGIGCFKNEGFGDIMVNPAFLISDEETSPLQLKKQEVFSAPMYVVTSGRKDKDILTCLKQIGIRNNFDYKIDKMVNAFLRDKKDLFKGLSKSQWGTLRNYSKHLNTKHQFMQMVFDKDSGFVYKGQSENEWRKENRRVVLKDYVSNLNDNEFFPFIIELSNQMAKTKTNESSIHA